MSPRGSSAFPEQTGDNRASLLRHAAAGAVLLALAGLVPAGPAQAAPVPAGSSQQAQGSAKQDQQAQTRANAIGQDGTRAPVGLSPGPRDAGATAENPTPHAPPGKRIVPGSENAAGPSSPTRTTLTGADSANAGPTGSSPSHRQIELPGTGAEAQTGPGTKLAKQAIPYQQHSQAARNPNGYNPAELAPASSAPQQPNAQGNGFNPAATQGVHSGR